MPALAFEVWYDAYVDCLASAHLRAQAPACPCGCKREASARMTG